MNPSILKPGARWRIIRTDDIRKYTKNKKFIQLEELVGYDDAVTVWDFYAGVLLHCRI